MSPDKLYDYFYNSKSVSIDSRTVKKGDIYFALKGERFDGNKFATDAIKNGASFAIIDDHSLNHPNFIKVENSLKALQELSKFHRSKLVKTKIIALTGSNGKTTTKELIREVLKTQYKVCSTEGNLNNHIGVPLTLLKIKPKADFAIIEMGANHLKEIEFLTRLINPDFGLITNFGKAHLEGFGSLEGVIKGKSELYDYLKKNNKIAFVNADDDIQNKFSGQKIAFSSNKKGLYNFEKNDSSRMSSLIYKNEIVKSNLTGKYNYSNIGFATLIGLHFKISINTIKKAILNYVPSNNRSQIISKDNKSIILGSSRSLMGYGIEDKVINYSLPGGGYIEAANLMSCISKDAKILFPLEYDRFDKNYQEYQHQSPIWVAYRNFGNVGGALAHLLNFGLSFDFLLGLVKRIFN